MIYPWEFFESFKINFYPNKNKIGLRLKEENYIDYGANNIEKWISIYVLKSQKYAIINFLREKIREDKKKYSYFENPSFGFNIIKFVVLSIIIILLLVSFY